MVLDARRGQVDLRLSGASADNKARNWAGGHRCQRVPPNERRGRVHTSTVTMAWLDLPVGAGARPVLDSREIEESLHHAGGAGGQHQNKTLSAVRLRHIPTGLIVDARTERSQHQNRAMAREWLAARVMALRQAENNATRSAERRRQQGSGQRGDKVATWRWQDDRVTDHRTDCRGSLRKALDGVTPWG